MFYNKISKELFYSDIFISKDASTYFLNALDDEELKSLDIARVISEPTPSFNDATEFLKVHESLDEKSNVYKITYSIEEKPLEELIALKCEQINTLRDEKLNAGFEFDGKLYQSTQLDQLRINGAVTNALVNANKVKEIEWIALDNSITQFSIDKFKLFASAMAYFVQATIFKANTLKSQAREAKNITELEAIIWEQEDDTNTK